MIGGLAAAAAPQNGVPQPRFVDMWGESFLNVIVRMVALIMEHLFFALLNFIHCKKVLSSILMMHPECIVL